MHSLEQKTDEKPKKKKLKPKLWHTSGRDMSVNNKLAMESIGAAQLSRISLFLGKELDTTYHNIQKELSAG